MPYDPTDDIFAELERKHRRRDEPQYTEPDPGLGAAAPDRIAETLEAAEERAVEQQQFAADVMRRGYGDAVKRKVWRDATK